MKVLVQYDPQRWSHDRQHLPHSVSTVTNRGIVEIEEVRGLMRNGEPAAYRVAIIDDGSQHGIEKVIPLMTAIVETLCRLWIMDAAETNLTIHGELQQAQ